MGETPLTCQFTTVSDGGREFRCGRTDYEVVAMDEDSYVRLCPKHRSWAAALGRGGEVSHDK
jgi:hypothetical protein